jgi:predicted transposase YdaD
MLDLRDATLRQTRFYQEVLQEGIQQGEADLVRLLTRRCGPLSEAQQAQVRALSRQQLEALLDFTGIADLEAWLV